MPTQSNMILKICRKNTELLLCWPIFSWARASSPQFFISTYTILCSRMN